MGLRATFKYLLLLLLSLNLAASSTFKELETYPSSLAKDYYIYRFLSEKNPSPNETWQLLNQIQNINPRLLKLIGEKAEDKEFKKAVKCLYLDSKSFWNEDEECMAIRISPSLLVTFDIEKREILFKKLNKLYKGEFEWMEPLLHKEPFDKAIKSPHFLYLYVNVGQNFRKNYFDKNIDKQTLINLSKEVEFDLFVNKVVIENSHENVAKSLLNLTPKDINVMPYSAFLLGLNALMHKNSDLAISWFTQSLQNSYYQSEKDRALFWLYLSSNDKSHLQKLAQSWDLNIYSIAAKEKLDEEFFEILSPEPTKEKKSNYSVTDPYTWRETLRFLKNNADKNLDNFINSLYTKETLPHYAFAKERLSGYKEHYFIAPYKEYLETFSIDRKALILAITKQESRFIPASISTSYALGMTQFMPFLAKHIAKEESIKGFDLDFMFNPKYAYKFANIHLNYLESWLFHPILVAYAYNGGIGFTRNMLTKENLFKKGEYEPFLSLELVPYPESREYGKKVLANYIVYKKELGERVFIWDLFETLSSPDALHRF